MGKKTSVAFIAFACVAGLAAMTARAGTQQCNTACQSRMTDCLLACDGRLGCELACKSQAVACVNACSSDAGAESEAAPAIRDGGASDSPGMDARADRFARPDAAKDAASRDR